MSERALRWLNAPEVTRERGFYAGGPLLAEEEARTEPVHVSVLGGKGDPAARAMFAAAGRPRGFVAPLAQERSRGAMTRLR